MSSEQDMEKVDDKIESMHREYGVHSENSQEALVSE